jgi:hypothetical protein
MAGFTLKGYAGGGQSRESVLQCSFSSGWSTRFPDLASSAAALSGFRSRKVRAGASQVELCFPESESNSPSTVTASYDHLHTVPSTAFCSQKTLYLLRRL